MVTKTFRSKKVHLRLRSGSLSAIALFQKMHLRLRIFCLFALTELTLFMHRIGTFEKRAMRLRAGGLSAIALLQKVHLRLRAGGLSAISQKGKFERESSPHLDGRVDGIFLRPLKFTSCGPRPANDHLPERS